MIGWLIMVLVFSRIFLLILGIAIAGCSPSLDEESMLTDSVKGERSASSPSLSLEESIQSSDSDDSNSSITSQEKYSVKFSPIDSNLNRMLEYSIRLEFESDDFSQTRDQLYKMAGEFGFLQSSFDEVYSSKKLIVSVWIRQEKLYEFLDASNSLGKLRSESIQTTDLTYENFEKNIQLKREAIRGLRRSKALSGSSESKNYTERERLLSDSENNEDQATKDKWVIQDRVSWAKVQVQIIDPKKENQLSIPNFSSILYDFANGGLYLIYIGFYLLPFALVGYFFWRNRSFIKKIYKKEQE
jgi:hypothetical protein